MEHMVLEFSVKNISFLLSLSLFRPTGADKAYLLEKCWKVCLAGMMEIDFKWEK